MPKGPNKIHEIALSLADYYHGKTVHVQFERQCFCATCKGEGATSWSPCGACGGSGSKNHMIMMGPMQAMVRGPCEACGTTGKRVETVCGDCGGRKLRAEKKEIDVVIEPGSRPGDTICFPRACSDHENFAEAGDVVFVLQEADEDGRFSRLAPTGDDLAVRTTISLENALLGCKETMQGHPGHPQGLVIEIPVGVQNGESFVVEGEGLPVKGGDGAKRGKLFVTVQVRPTAAEKEALVRGAAVLQLLFRPRVESGGL
jgi:DnaJ-class molecular chaperone